MIKKSFILEKYSWSVTIYFDVDEEGLGEVVEALFHLNCSSEDASNVYRLINEECNTGFTYTNYTTKSTITCIGCSSNIEEFGNTVFHEVFHIQDHIARYYGFKDDLELPAYLSGTIGATIITIMLNILNKFGI